MKPKRHEQCAIHNNRYDCCGREAQKPIPRRKYESLEQGVRIIPDEHHPRGYRELRSKSAMRRLLVQKIRDQHGLCGICQEELTDYRDTVPDHIEPKGLGGGRTDDHPSNIQAAHASCNLEKGSKRISTPGPVLVKSES